MSDSYGSLDRARYHRIAAEYGHDIASLHYDVFDTGSSFGPMVIPRIHGRIRQPLPSHPIGGISLPEPEDRGESKKSIASILAETLSSIEKNRETSIELLKGVYSKKQINEMFDVFRDAAFRAARGEKIFKE